MNDVEQLLSGWAGRSKVLGLEAWQWLGLALAMVAAVMVGRVGGAIVKQIAKLTRKTDVRWDDELASALKRPSNLLITVIVGWLASEPLRLAGTAKVIVDRALQIGLIWALAWVGMGAIQLVAGVLERKAERDHTDGDDGEVRLRAAQTQIHLLRRVVSIVVLIVAVALMLVQFEVVRTVGVSLLASAGIAGIVIGLAAQRTIATLIAGVQLSLTQTVRIGDVVIVEGEWGTVEEMNLTYICVKVWDERRLVVPIAHFLEKPFQNWTRGSQELLGTVFFHADYALPLEAVREALDGVLEGNPLWDGRTKGVLVTDAKPQTIEVRALVSAKNASDQWDLRCEVREKLIAWLREYEGGRFLPRVRVVESPENARRGGAVAG
jgi:small-conductance mechanosensitive channel